MTKEMAFNIEELRGLENSSWSDILREQRDLVDRCLIQTEQARLSGEIVYPPRGLIFEALRRTPVDQIGCVILGQDVYHGAGQAHGLAFSVQQQMTFPPSLRNIFQELHEDVGLAVPASGNLSKWTDRVLLLNSYLTVAEARPASHAKFGWGELTDALLSHVSATCTNVVFLLWGKHAHEKCRLIDQSQHFVLKTSHPSPLGAAKRGADFIPFRGSRCFSKANAYLMQHGKAPIEWRSIEGSTITRSD